MRLLSPVARRLGLGPLWVTCDPENVASRRTLERLGAELVEEVDVPPDCVIFESGHPRKCRYRIDLDEGRGGGQVEATQQGERCLKTEGWRTYGGSQEVCTCGLQLCLYGRKEVLFAVL